MTTNVARAVNTTSHVTASPSAGHAAHAQARAAQNPVLGRGQPGVQVLDRVPVRAGGQVPTVTAVVLAPQIPTEPALTIDQRALVTYLLEQFCADKTQPAADIELGRAAIVRIAAMADDALAYKVTPAPVASLGVPQTADELRARLLADGMTDVQAEAIITAPGSPFAQAPSA